MKEGELAELIQELDWVEVDKIDHQAATAGLNSFIMQGYLTDRHSAAQYQYLSEKKNPAGRYWWDNFNRKFVYQVRG